MEWKQAQDDLWETADRLERLAHLWSKKLLREDRERAERALDLALRCRRLSERRLTVPQGLEHLPREEVLIRLYRVLKSEVKAFFPTDE